MAKTFPAVKTFSFPLLCLMVFFVILFATGGSSRDDELQIAVLQPASVSFCAVGIYFLFRTGFVNSGILQLLVATMTALALIHVVPLPPALWQALPNQHLVIDIQSSVNIENNWRPLTVSPNLGWSSALSFIAAFAIALLANQLNKRELQLLLPVLITLSSISGLIGFLQSIGFGQLYVFQVTNSDSAVGLLANRNHAATLLACIFPMLAVLASTTEGETQGRNIRQIFSAAIALVTVPLILVTGSRAGLLVGLIGLVGAGLIYRPAKPRLENGKSMKQSSALRRNLISGSLIFGLTSITFFVSRAKAVERLFEITPGEDGRFSFVQASANLALKYLPLGSGAGSFADVYKVIEMPASLSAVYINHSHSDWIETALTFGVPGILLMSISIVIYTIQTHRLWRFGNPDRRSITLARMASVCLFILAVSSLSDYPLRTPLLLCLTIVFSTMLLSANAKLSSKTEPM